MPLPPRFVMDTDHATANQPRNAVLRTISIRSLMSVVLLAGLSCVCQPAAAQFQGVQPIFNQQLGAWPPGGNQAQQQQQQQQQRAGRRIPGRNFTIPVYPGHWGGFGYGYPAWGPPFGGYYGSGFYGGWRRSTFGAVPVNPVIVVQPQIVVPPAVVAPQPAMRQAGPPPLPRIDLPAAAAPEDEIRGRVAALKPSTENGRTRADHLIAEGDREFAAGQYRRAALKYRDAINRAADYSAAYLRAGHAYTAGGDYELAVTYFAMGFELARTTDRGGFSLETLFRGDEEAKRELFVALEDAIKRQPDQGGLAFLFGIHLHYDGKPLPARDLFKRAAETAGRHQPYAELFLPAAEKP